MLIGEVVTLYRISTDSRGPRLLSALYEVRQNKTDRFFTELVNVDGQAGRRPRKWPRSFSGEFGLYNWKAFESVEDAWQDYISRKTRDHAQDQNAVDRNASLIRLAKLRSKKQKKEQ